MDSWEKRWNPLRREWIIYAAHRNKRPWDGKGHETSKIEPSYLHNCYLCPGNTRVSGKLNPNYENVFVFDNDVPIVGLNAPQVKKSDHNDLYITEGANGFSKVICYSPDHSKTMSDLSVKEIAKIIHEWKKVTLEAKEKQLVSVLVFENKGEITGVSNFHPHCQVYATDFIFNHTKLELASMKKYRKEKNRNLFDDILQAEIKDGNRIITENEKALAFIPFFAKYAYEVMLIPKIKSSSLLELKDSDIEGISQVYLDLIKKYDALFDINFPYVMSIMQAPLQESHLDYQMYFHFQPPLRIPGIRKYLAGPEIGGGNFMADTIPEVSAEKLRSA